MKRRKIDVKSLSREIYNSGKIRFLHEESDYYFEIGKEITTDLAEATAILMRVVETNDKIWNLKIDVIDYEKIEPSRCLFWLTGGHSEWSNLENYNKPWSSYYLDFQEEFGFLIISILKKSKTLGDLRYYFTKHLNLPILYEFALSRNMI
jgi:hypothetical protein